MEAALWLISTKALWLEVLALAVFSLMTVVYLFSSARPPERMVRVACPFSHDKTPVHLKINIFRNPKKIGKDLDVVRCPHFSGGYIPCFKECIHTDRAQRIFQVETERHAEESRTLIAR